MTSFYSQDELKELGLKHLGKNVLLSRKTSIYGASNISIGDHSRIDDFSLLSGHIHIGRHVHIAAFCALFAGKAGITVNDFAGVSSRTNIYAESDDFSGEYMSGPTIPEKYRRTIQKHVTIGKYAIIGCGSMILPGGDMCEGSILGAQSLLKGGLEPWTINVGSPARKIKERRRDLLEKSALLEHEQ